MGASNLSRLIDQSVMGGVDIPTSFLSDFKRTISEDTLQHQRKPTPTYKPSSLKCIRNMYFQRVEAEQDIKKINPSMVGVAESGSDRHERIQKYVQKMSKYGSKFEWVKVSDYLKEHPVPHLQLLDEDEYETKLEHDILKLRFKCDGILKYDNEYYILEIKTESSYKWSNRMTIDEEHLPQGSAYSTLLNIDKVLFLYECRDICDWRVFVLEVTPEMRSEYVLLPIARCEKYVQSKEVPPKPIIATKKFCRYCNYTKQCKIHPNIEE